MSRLRERFRAISFPDGSDGNTSSADESRSNLQGSLSQFGNVIVVHLSLIVSYVELGRNQDAQTEAAEVMRLNTKFSLAEQKKMYSGEPPLRERYWADLTRAGLK
jgi:hypothetical protein